MLTPIRFSLVSTSVILPFKMPFSANEILNINNIKIDRIKFKLFFIEFFDEAKID
jgi:hypothetical protein